MKDNSYCFASIEKKSNMKQLSWAYRHNYRASESAAPFAYADQRYKNEELIKDDFGVPNRNFVEVYQNKVKESPYYKTHKVRKNCVPAIEILLGFSKERRDDIDLEEWKKANVEWLQDTYGKENVISAMFHDDEKDENDPRGTGCHIHAIVIPMDSRGCLNASEIVGGRRQLGTMLNEYAKKMSVFGLRRGEFDSFDRHMSPKAFRSRVDDELLRIKENIPSPEVGESAVKYRERLEQPMWQVARDHTEDLLEYERKEQKRRLDEAKERKAKKLDEQLKELVDAKAERKMEKDLKEIQAMLGFSDQAPTKEQIHEAKKKLRIGNQLAEAFQNYPDQDYAKRVNDEMAMIMQYNNKLQKKRGAKARTEDD